MRGVDGQVVRLRSRVKGRPALLRRLRGLVLAVDRFGRCRARSHEDLVWASMVMTRLMAALGEADETERA